MFIMKRSCQIAGGNMGNPRASGGLIEREAPRITHVAIGCCRKSRFMGDLGRSAINPPFYTHIESKRHFYFCIIILYITICITR